MWGIGVDGTIYEWEKYGLSIFGDINYRQAKDIGAETLVIDGTEYKLGDFDITAKAKWEEWQVALGIAMKFKYFIPTYGIKYFDVKTSAKISYSGDTYGSDSAKSKNKVDPFIGVSIIPVKGISIDLDGGSQLPMFSK